MRNPFNSDRQYPPMTIDNRLAYSIKDTCELSSLGKTRIYELIGEGALEVTRIGRRTLVRGESLRKLLETGCKHLGWPAHVHVA